jgi:aldehyde dehydrogenase
MAATLEQDGIATVPSAASRLRMTLPIRSRYEHWINGEYAPPATGEYFANPSPVTGQFLCDVARGTTDDIERALDAAHVACRTWRRTSVAERAHILNRIADRVEANLEALAVIETIDNGKPIRESIASDLPLVVDHFRYFAGCIRTQEAGLSQLDDETVAYRFNEPLGVVGQSVPWNFPLLMATRTLAPALAAGNCIVLKPAEQTPVSIMALMELVSDLLPPGVVNIVQGFGLEAGRALARSSRAVNVALADAMATAGWALPYAPDSVVPGTLAPSGKSPNIFFADVMDTDDDFLDKALEGFGMFALNQGEACTCPSRALVQASIYDAFMERATARVASFRLGHPLELSTQVGAQTAFEQLETILSYVDIGRAEGARVRLGGARFSPVGETAEGYYVKPTILEGTNSMHVFQEPIFGPVVSVTRFTDEAEALQLANDTRRAEGAGVWTRNINTAYRVGREIQAGRVWTNCYHAYAAFGDDSRSSIGRESGMTVLHHFQQTKSVLVSYGTKALGFF